VIVVFTDVGLAANVVLDAVFKELACSVLGVPCRKFISLYEPSIPCCDYLVVWVDAFGGTGEFNGCEDYDDSAEIVFRVKLMRPCPISESCDVTVKDQEAVSRLLNDAVIVRNALFNAVYGLGAAGFESVGMCGLSFQVLPVGFVGGDTEGCSGVVGGVGVRLVLCADDCLLPPDLSGCVPCGEGVVGGVRVDEDLVID
jgi:hypothetical protein